MIQRNMLDNSWQA